MSAIYNDNDQFSAAWLEGLISSGQIPEGVVDRRSIADLSHADVAGSGHRHFFAGIGGWAHALRLAGVPDDADIWTGSCPCQGLSDAGKRRGFLDPRHLWPTWLALIEQCRPAVIFGEQVASKLGLHWLDLVFSDLERCGYAVGAADLCAAGVGAPHQRQRIFFVAYADGEPGRLLVRSWRSWRAQAQTERCGEDSGMGDPGRARRSPRAVSQPGGDISYGRYQATGDVEPTGTVSDMADSARQRRGQRGKKACEDRAGSSDHRAHGQLADADCARFEVERQQQARRQLAPPQRGGQTRGFWADADWIWCRDPSGGPPIARPVEPGAFPLAHGVSGRVGILRGYGNAIVPQVAAEFVRSALDAIYDSLTTTSCGIPPYRVDRNERD